MFFDHHFFGMHWIWWIIMTILVLLVVFNVIPIIVITYVLLGRREEQKIIEEFEEEYLEYKWNVPDFLPVKGKWKQFIQRSGNSSDDPA